MCHSIFTQPILALLLALTVRAPRRGVAVLVAIPGARLPLTNPEPAERCTALALLDYLRCDEIIGSTGLTGEGQLRESHEDCRAACSGNARAMEQQLQQALETASADDTQTEQAAVRREFAQRVAKSRARESEVQGGQAAMQAACKALPVSHGSDVV